jgi:uncharacterized protein YjiS (DUF1127 family)
MTTTALRNRFALRCATASSLAGDALATLGLWRQRARQRRHLAEMSAEMLRDIGVSPGQARAEAGKPFWVA